MFAVIGLGNPGKKYAKTRHNAGYLVVDYILNNYKIPFKSGKWDYYFGEVSINNERIICIKPTTYMNRSGLAIHQVLKYFPVDIENLLIVHDDYNIPFGTLRIRPSGSDGGHNGIKSIIYELQGEEFNRLRFGIGNNFSDAVNYVLSDFNKYEFSKIEDLLDMTLEAITCWIKDGIQFAMNKFNRSFINQDSN